MEPSRQFAAETDAADSEVPAAGGTLRWVRCAIADGLLRLGEPAWRLRPSVKAALLWRAFRRYSELVGLKRLAGGLSGSDVLVFRPRLKTPPPSDDPDLATAGPVDVLAGAWGSPLLVKTGRASELRKEWVRYNRFLRDRQSPFIAHLEELLVVEPAAGADPDPRAVLVGTFLGGDVLPVEPLDKVIRGTADTGRCLRLLDQVFGHLATWHTNPEPRPLQEWTRVFHPRPGGWLLFGRYDLRKEDRDQTLAPDVRTAAGKPAPGRREFAAGLGWDVPFGKGDHLHKHLLGTPAKPGLLDALRTLPVQFSLIHGDLNPRNVLCDADRTWLIDFEHTGVGPVLADFARLEINLRFWCISLAEATAGPGPGAEDLERLLLAHFLGGDSLEPVGRFAEGLGADRDALQKIARCIAHLRTLARRWCGREYVDGRDYLAVLYLTLLRLLPAAAGSAGQVPAANMRWGMSLFWVLGETLDRVLGREPYDRGQRPYDPLRHIDAAWLRADGAALRVHHLSQTADGREVLGPVVALHGVLQGGHHHLDAYRHTLSVLAYLEAILRDPVAALRDPATLDAAVTSLLAENGLSAPPPVPEQRATPVACDWLTDDQRTALRAYLATHLTDEAALLLKWCALLHDVGKPGTRTVRRNGDREEVQFIGHEVHGVALVDRHLAAWFPGPERPRLEALIENHHTSHQLLGNRLFADAAVFDGLRAAGGGRPDAHLRRLLQAEEEKAGGDLPLLLLHGYADRLSARGVKPSPPVAAWAEATLAVLAGLSALPELVAGEAAAKAVDAPLREAAQAYADELLLRGALVSAAKGRAIGRLRKRLAGRAGTTEELLAWLRAHVPADELAAPR